ncbi:hypothetical protein JHK86_045704 [Glycine max]|nr:hypothetical protein JHK86_045704 [Glycine max]
MNRKYSLNNVKSVGGENSDGNRDRKQEDGNRRMVEDANTQGHATILGAYNSGIVFRKPDQRKATLLLSIMYEVADSVTPRFTDVFAAMIAALNTEFAQVGNLFDSRKIIARELLTVLLEKPIDDSVEVAKSDPNFQENEKRYKELKKSMLGEESEDDDEEGLDADESDNGNKEEEEHMQIKDEMETNLVNLRKTKYSAIMSSVDLEEAGHKLLEIKLEPGQEMELCIMILECCRQEKNLSLILESSRAVFADVAKL